MILAVSRKVTRSSRFVAGALALTLALVSSAICVVATLQIEDTQQHASCRMSHESGSQETTRLDCCIAQSAQFAWVAPETGVPVVAQPVLVSLVGATPDSLILAIPPLTAFDSDVPKPPVTPTYLPLSVFRL